MANPTVIITCTQPRADTIVSDLINLGLSAAACPALTVKPTNAPRPHGDYDTVLLSSGNAVLHGRSIPHKPVIAVGQTTAFAAQGAGLECEYVGHGTMEDTVTCAALKQAQHILYPCGVYRSKNTDALLQRLDGKVTMWPVYETAFNDGFGQSIPPIGEKVVVLFSVRGAESFINAMKNTPELHDIHALCLSQTIADTLGDIPLKSLAVCPRPDYACLTEMIVDLVNTEGQKDDSNRHTKRH